MDGSDIVVLEMILIQQLKDLDGQHLEAIVVGLMVGADRVWAHLKGKRRDHRSNDRLERIEQKVDEEIGLSHQHAADKLDRLDKIEGKVDRMIDWQTNMTREMLETFGDHDSRIKALSAYVIGPDGQNGHRGDIRDLRERMTLVERRHG